MNTSYQPGDRTEEHHKALMDFLVSASGDVAAIRDALKVNTAALTTIGMHLSKLVTLAEKGRAP